MRNPIEQLHDLLEERNKVSQKIAEVESTLTDVTHRLSMSLARQCLDDSAPPDELKERLLKEEQTYERLLQALQDMQAQIEERVRPVAQQVVEAEIERLRALFEEHKAALGECLARIDANILNCRSCMEEYHQTRYDLASLSERLSKLGADAAPLPDGLPGEDVRDVIMARLEHLRAQAKL
ncbi:MAG TPA: hypothetical protein VNO43_13335 [Candidatus Eisenbacteria bacterium]|nr:hypothetical protein [Candidatus Eisenbacteria bacterium]